MEKQIFRRRLLKNETNKLFQLFNTDITELHRRTMT